MPRTVPAVSLVAMLIVGAVAALAGAASLPECTTDSQQNPQVIVRSAPCGTYWIMTTRREAVAGVEQDVTVQFMIHTPAGAPKALVALFTGGAGNAGLTGDPVTHQVFTNSNNFLVRSAQMFAERGYLAVTVDRPSTAPATNPEYDQYRIAPRHAQDIVTVINRANRWNLNVFLAGTSRGALSVVAQWMLGSGSMLSSPVTSGAGPSLYVGHPGTPNLQPGFVRVPVHVMTHALDGCAVSTPAGAAALHQQFLLAGTSSDLDQMNGGFDLSGLNGITPCDAVTYHGYLGIENAAVGEVTARMDGVLRLLRQHAPFNHRPITRPARLTTTATDPVTIDLRRLAFDPNGHPLAFSLPYATSSRGAPIALQGTLATYRPSQAGIVDGFVWVVADGRGGRSANVVTVEVASGLAR